MALGPDSSRTGLRDHSQPQSLSDASSLVAKLKRGSRATSGGEVGICGAYRAWRVSVYPVRNVIV
jgi:hypothetical protein